jgi:hypothetical protein
MGGPKARHILPVGVSTRAPAPGTRNPHRNPYFHKLRKDQNGRRLLDVSSNSPAGTTFLTESIHWQESLQLNVRRANRVYNNIPLVCRPQASACHSSQVNPRNAPYLRSTWLSVDNSAPGRPSSLLQTYGSVVPLHESFCLSQG